MLDFSIYPIHPLLKPYMQVMTAMRIRDENLLTVNFSATTNAGLVFFFGSQSSAIQYDFMVTPDKHYTFDNRQAWIGGMHNEAIHSKFVSAETKIACAVFTPVGIYNLLRDDSVSLMNDGVSFENAGLMKKFDGLTEKLYEIEDNIAAMKVIESYLLNYFSRLETPFSVKDMSPVVNFIVRQKGIVRIHDLEDKFRISRRWLEKQFIAQVGFSPKEFARIIRFKSLLASIENTPSASSYRDSRIFWSTLVEDYGYYDQSHLIKDFHQFTGLSPTAYFKTEMLPVDSIFN
jgi:AraC-like DNA-binding protein